MPDPAEYLIVASSARALGAAARRSGVRAYALDLFGDVDTAASVLGNRVVAGDLEHGFGEAALLDAADQLAPRSSTARHGLVYGAGFEDRPELLARLARGRRLCGNSPETVARSKDPRIFFGTLDALRIPHPELSFTVPHGSDGWLVKRIGASGGSHVMPAGIAAHDATDRYYQRRVAGRAIGVSFLADGRRAFLLGCNEQWTAPDATQSFRFGGILQPAAVHARVAARLRALLDPLVEALGLVGLNSLDVLVDDEHYHVIEVNPRPGANLDLYDGADPRGLFALHVRACAGELPQAWQSPVDATALAVVYADDATAVTQETAWPEWVADRPAPGQRIAAGSPVCTVFARAASPSGARRLVAARRAAIHSLLQNQRAGLAATQPTRIPMRSGSTA